MIQRASKWLKCLYCLTLVVMIIPAGLMGASGAVGMATGGGLIGYGRLTVLVLIVGLLFRIYWVMRFPESLNIFANNIGIKILRGLGILLMIAGLTASLLIFFIKPLTLAIFGQAGDAGVAFFFVGIVLYVISLTGWLGVILFECSRFAGMTVKRRNRIVE